MPSIFSRFADIINSNLNAMLDKAENPQKMLKLIIGEMEDTLAEIKAACAQSMAEEAKIGRKARDAEEKRDLWARRAELAVEKNRDDLAREALLERRDADQAVAGLREQLNELEALVIKYRAEIEQLEAKVAQAREREEILRLRRHRAEHSLKASRQMKQYDLTAASLRLERLDSRLEQLEADAALELSGRRLPRLEDDGREKAFRDLDDSLEKELRALKDKVRPA